MSATDDRVVSMKFDNAAFQQNVADTLKSLEKLKSSLDLAGAAKGLDDLSTAGKSFTMGGMGDAVDGVSKKFLALATVGITALSNITNKVVDAGVQLLKSFTFTPITDGFHEFETNMDSIQTILSNTKSKGSTLDDVNKALDQLNTYSDKTIYNFTQMAKNIGTFTAAGVGLDTSVKSIKGIANLAALSGSSADQASTAMYQLSQAIASGSVKLMDWNSVVNAGMGGETFQKALFESGKAMKTLTDVPAGQTFEEWKKAGNSFRDSLQEGWITTDVLTKTLSAFTGDLSVAQIQAMGYSKTQAQMLFDMGQTGQQAATQVKTFSQLLDTTKEAVGSGWTKTFQILFGTFDESRTLFTNISNAINKFVGNSADARNAVLSDWKEMGGRTVLINALKDAIQALGEIVAPIKEAFREFFPAKTGKDLMRMTTSFANFAHELYPTGETLDKIKRIFEGLFAVFDIIINVVIEVKDLFLDLFHAMAPAGSGASDMAARLGDLAVKLDDFLVNGGKLHDFFLKLREVIKAPIDVLQQLVDKIKDFFGQEDKAGEGSSRVTSRFDEMTAAGKRVADLWDRLGGVFDRVGDALKKAGDVIGAWFKDLGHNIAQAMKPGDFNSAVDVVNVGLLGGITLMLKKFLDGLKSGQGLDMGDGIFNKIKASLDGVKDTLKAMQTELKAKALMEIAIALGVLTVSIVALSLIDSANLTKALAAMTVAFGELVGTMAALDKVIGDKSDAAKMALVSIALNGIASSMVIFAGAIAILAQLGWEGLAKGMAGVTAGMAIMVTTTQLLSTNSEGLIGASIAMNAMATAMNIMALAVKSFAEMSWGEMAKGLGGVAAALLIVTVAMNSMPGPMIVGAGIAMIAIATGLRILAEAVQAFGELSWTEIAKGLTSIGVALGLIVIAMNLMPLTLPITAAGLVLVGGALVVIAEAVKLMGSQNLGTLAKGIGSIAAMLAVLAAGMYLMEGALPGAAAMLVVAGALTILSAVIIKLGETDIKTLAIGLGAIAAAMLVLGLAALVMEPVVPSLLALGIALGVVGLAFTLFGVGAYATAKAFEVIAQAGKAGIAAIIDAIQMFIEAIPRFVAALVDSLLKSAGDFLDAGTLLLKIATVFLGQLLDTVIVLAPKIAEAIVAIVTSAIKLIKDLAPDLIDTGFFLLTKLLQGIKDHIIDITNLAVDIVVRFAQTLTNNAQKLVDAAVNLLLSFLKAIADRAGDIVGAGLNLVIHIVEGIAQNIGKIIEAAANIIVQLVKAIGDSLFKVVNAGGDAVAKFLQGIGDNISKVITAGVDLVIKIAQSISDNAIKMARSAADILIGFLNGLADVIREKTPELRKAGLNVVSAIIDGMTGGIASKAGDVAGGLVNVGKDALGKLGGLFKTHSPSKVMFEFGKNIMLGWGQGVERENAPVDAIVTQGENIVRAFQETLGKIPDSVADITNLNPTITPVLDLTKVKSKAKDLTDLMSNSAIAPNVSLENARIISSTAVPGGSVPDSTPTGPTEIKFEQTINSPTALSTNDIYRNTNSQIARAKEELKI